MKRVIVDISCYRLRICLAGARDRETERQREMEMEMDKGRDSNLCVPESWFGEELKCSRCDV